MAVTPPVSTQTIRAGLITGDECWQGSCKVSYVPPSQALRSTVNAIDSYLLQANPRHDFLLRSLRHRRHRVRRAGEDQNRGGRHPKRHGRFAESAEVVPRVVIYFAEVGGLNGL
jgi:hypothetical protein